LPKDRVIQEIDDQVQNQFYTNSIENGQSHTETSGCQGHPVVLR
jgi:hypothetical protein